MATKQKSAGGSLLELVVIVAVALGLALGTQAFLVKPYRIPSESMVPTLKVGQRVLVNRIGNRFTDPRVGDVIVFHPPKGSDNDTCGDGRRRQGQACDRPTSGRATATSTAPAGAEVAAGATSQPRSPSRRTTGS